MSESGDQMPFVFADWMHYYRTSAGADQGRRARAMILEGERRIDVALDMFKDRLVAHFERLVGAGALPGDASVQALENAVTDIVPNARDYAFLIRLAVAYDAVAVSHMTWRKLLRFSTLGLMDPHDPPPAIPALLAEVHDPEKIAWWMTADPCADDPGQMALVLGLPHFQGNVAYWFELDVGGLDQFTPSCLDAGVYEAWQEPPSGHKGPCGLTRHVETGQRIHNEFILRCADVDARAVSMKRLPIEGPVTPIGSMKPDFLVGR